MFDRKKNTAIFSTGTLPGTPATQMRDKTDFQRQELLDLLRNGRQRVSELGENAETRLAIHKVGGAELVVRIAETTFTVMRDTCQETFAQIDKTIADGKSVNQRDVYRALVGNIYGPFVNTVFVLRGVAYTMDATTMPHQHLMETAQYIEAQAGVLLSLARK